MIEGGDMLVVMVKFVAVVQLLLSVAVVTATTPCGCSGKGSGA